MRSGWGQASSPTVSPAGSVHSTVMGSPESPGLSQYVCQPGAMRWRTPSHCSRPGSRAARSLIKSTATRGVPRAAWA